MAIATLTAKGQVVIPVEIRTRHELTPGTQVEFVDEAGVIRLLVRRRLLVCEQAAGYGMTLLPPANARNQYPQPMPHHLSRRWPVHVHHSWFRDPQ